MRTYLHIFSFIHEFFEFSTFYIGIYVPFSWKGSHKLPFPTVIHKGQLISDVGLRGILLCGARTPALKKLFRTHLRTAPHYLVIAPTPALALFHIIHMVKAFFFKSAYDFPEKKSDIFLYTCTDRVFIT